MFDFDREIIIPLLVANNIQALRGLKNHKDVKAVSSERYSYILEKLIDSAIEQARQAINNERLKGII